MIGLTVGVWFAGILLRGGSGSRGPRLGVAGSGGFADLLSRARLDAGEDQYGRMALLVADDDPGRHPHAHHLAADDQRPGSAQHAPCRDWLCRYLWRPCSPRSLCGRISWRTRFPGFAWVVGIPAAFSTVFTLILWFRGVRLFRGGIPRPVRIGWRVAGYAMLAAVAFYLGRATAPGPSLFDRSLSPLVQMPADELGRQTTADLQRLRIIATQLEELEAKTQVIVGDLARRRQTEGRLRLTPEEDDFLRGQFMTYLACRDGLLRMVAMYGGYDAVRDPDLRARCVLLGHASGSLVFEYSLKLVHWYLHDDAIHQKLNEADCAGASRPGMFDRIYANVSSSSNIEALAEIGGYVEANGEAWRAAGLPSGRSRLAHHPDRALGRGDSHPPTQPDWHTLGSCGRPGEAGCLFAGLYDADGGLHLDWRYPPGAMGAVDHAGSDPRDAGETAARRHSAGAAELVPLQCVSARILAAHGDVHRHPRGSAATGAAEGGERDHRGGRSEHPAAPARSCSSPPRMASRTR